MSTKETEVNMDMDIRHPVDGWTIDRQLMIMAMQSYEIPKEVNLKKERERSRRSLPFLLEEGSQGSRIWKD